MTDPRVSVIVPRGSAFDLDGLSAWESGAPVARPFHDSTLGALVAIGRELRSAEVAARHPEVSALGFWLREAPLREARDGFLSTLAAGVVASPRGTVFHVPPGNVDTVFVYSWALAALTGNRNIVRLPTGSDDVVDGICDVISTVLDRPEHHALRDRTRFVRYGHDRAVTAALSATCDVRVLWGGDGSVADLRSVPLPVHATELTFPDRFAFSLLDSTAVAKLDSAALARLAERFVTDSYWFDQMACSSPRLVVWRGRRDANVAADRFFEAVQAAVERVGYSAPLSAVLGKFVHAAGAATDQPVAGLARLSNELFTVRLASLSEFDRRGPGGGFFYWAIVDDLVEVADFAVRRDQTVTHFGLTLDELRALAEAANGRGIDRLVPIGRALAINRFWDGYDLLAEFVRLTHVEVER